MLTYPLIIRSKFPYAEHLEHNQYLADPEQGISRVAGNAGSEQAISGLIILHTFQRHAEFLARTVTADNDFLAQGMKHLNGAVVYGLQQVNNGVSNLNADFDIAMGKVLIQFEMLRGEMQIGFEEILHRLDNPRKSAALEHLRDALAYYQDGNRFADRPEWFDAALRHFHAAIELHERLPLAHLNLGHLYHYQSRYRDFEKALHHYSLSFAYAEAEDSQRAIAAQGYFYAGWLCAAEFENFEHAVKLTQKALELDPTLGEAHYHLAKFSALSGDPKGALEHLKHSIIRHDRNYCIKATGDPDFNAVREPVQRLLEGLRDHARRNFSRKLQNLERDFDPHDARWRKRLEQGWRQLDSSASDGTYFTLLDANQHARRLAELITRARQERARHYDRAVRAVQEWERFVGNYVCFDQSVFENTKSGLLHARELAVTDSHAEHDQAVELTYQFWIDSLRFTAIERFHKHAHLRGETAVVFSPDCRYLASASTQDKRIRLWEVASGRDIAEFYGSGHTDGISNIVFSPDGQYLASASLDGTIRLWHAANGRAVRGFSGKGHTGPVYGVAFSPDGRFLASGGQDRRLRLWQLPTGLPVPEFEGHGHADAISSIEFDASGDKILTASFDHTIRLWHRHDGKLVKEFDGVGHLKAVHAAAFSRDGRFIASGSSDSTIILWDAQYGRPIENVNIWNDYQPVMSVAFSPDGRFIASGRPVRIWEFKSGKPLKGFDGAGNCVAYSSDGRAIAAGSNNGFVRVLALAWRPDPGVWMEKRQYERLKSEAERQEEERKAELARSQREEVDRRRKEGRCIVCGDKIGFFFRRRSRYYCKEHAWF